MHEKNGYFFNFSKFLVFKYETFHVNYQFKHDDIKSLSPQAAKTTDPADRHSRTRKSWYWPAASDRRFSPTHWPGNDFCPGCPDSTWCWAWCRPSRFSPSPVTTWSTVSRLTDAPRSWKPTWKTRTSNVDRIFFSSLISPIVECKGVLKNKNIYDFHSLWFVKKYWMWNTAAHN